MVTMEHSHQQKSESSPQSLQKGITQSGGERLTEEVPTSQRRNLPSAPKGMGVEKMSHPVGDASQKQGRHPNTSSPLASRGIKGKQWCTLTSITPILVLN